MASPALTEVNTSQAIEKLAAENERLRQQNELLEERLSEVTRLAEERLAENQQLGAALTEFERRFEVFQTQTSARIAQLEKQAKNEDENTSAVDTIIKVVAGIGVGIIAFFTLK